jgi:hypothetical protein
MAYRPPQSDPLDEADEGMAELKRAGDWDALTPVVHVNVQQAAKRSPLPPAPAPNPPASTLQIVFGTFNRFPPWGAVLVAVAAIAGWVYLAINGKAPVP